MVKRFQSSQTKMAQMVLYLSLMLLIVLATAFATAAYPGRLRVRAVRESANIENDSVPPEYVEHNYTQTLDHFNYNPESYQTFQQRSFLNFKYWGGANTSSPIFVYLGEEGDITSDIQDVAFIAYLAAQFNGLVLHIEHRYYGKSIPFGRIDYQNLSALGYFSSTQALADYAEVIINVKKDLSAETCPVVAVGASYGGMLASWLRLKYPHVVIGSLASSAPILYFDDITPQDGYHAVVSRDFRNTSESCYNTIIQSWTEIDRVAGEPNGLGTLGDIFTTCRPLNSSRDLKDTLELTYMVSAQYDNPPNFYVENLCAAIDGAPAGTDVLTRVAAGLNASFGRNQRSCNYITSEKSVRGSWDWQTCTEIVIPMGVDNNNTMFQPSPFDLNGYSKTCQDLYGVNPRPHWITTEFGGHDIKSVLAKFGSNIIFSNGLRDPYSSGGILQDISESLVAIYTEQGAHCLDVLTPAPSDPEWLVAQRDKEIKVIAQWIAEYNARRINKVPRR